jgi:hypothetical protein
MEMVVHDHVSVHGHFENASLFGQQAEQALAVGVVAHNELAVISALDHMMGVSGNSEAGLARHDEQLKWKTSV